jgi:hypothetical protein
MQQLKARLQDLRKDLETLESLVSVDVPSSLNKIRFVTEKVLHKLCRSKGTSWGQGEPTLERMIGPLLAGEHIPKSVGIHIRTIQNYTSPGSHYQASTLTASHLRIAQDALIEFLWWYHTWAHGPLEVLGEHDSVMPAEPRKNGAVEVVPAESPLPGEVVPVRDSKAGKSGRGRNSSARAATAWAQPAVKQEPDRDFSEAEPFWESLGSTKAPGIALVAVSVAGVLTNSWMLLASGNGVEPVLVVMVMLALICSMVVCAGGICMLQRKCYWFVVATAGLSMFALLIASIFGLPVGVWALIVLLSKPVRDSFH